MTSRTSGLDNRSSALRDDPISKLYAELARRPEIISFAVGAPDPALLPVQRLELFTRVAQQHHGPALLQYGATRGFPPLLEAVEELLGWRGISGAAERTHISTGGSGALNSIAMAVLEPGDKVLVERPTFSLALSVFASYGATIVEVETDDDGMVPTALATELAAGGVAMVYLLPTFQNPTGRTASSGRRKELADVLQRYDAFAVEDDVYWDLRYRGEHLPALAMLAPGNVAYVTSVSKILAPALRVGVATMPAALLKVVLSLKQGIDMQTSTYMQAIATQMLTSTWFAGHLEHLIEVYRSKMTALLSALDQLPAGFRYSRPEGGFFAWIEGPADFDADALLPRALDAGVMYLPGSGFHADGGAHRNTLRLSIASPTVPEIDRGVEILANLIDAERQGIR
jgi:2-aminoadipate transaminase